MNIKTGPALLLITCLIFSPIFSLSGDESSLRILRPRVEGEQISPTWTEIYYIVIDARHPGGIARLQLFKEGAKKAERVFSEKDRHESGYFLYKRRMKSPSTRNYVIKMWPMGSDPETDDPIVSDRNFPLKYDKPDPNLRNFMAFSNLSDGDVIEANDPGDSRDLTYVWVDCQDSSGTWGGGQWKEDKHVGYRDDDGIEWVELVITGPDGKDRVVRNESAYVSEQDQKFHGLYWGEAVDSNHTKTPEEPWREGLEWKPIEGFGLYHFPISLSSGEYRLGLRARNLDGEILEGPSVGITVKSKRALCEVQ